MRCPHSGIAAYSSHTPLPTTEVCRRLATPRPGHKSRKSRTAFSILPCGPRPFPWAERSEEHTSELQSHLNLVCRLLLEKKKRRSRNTLQLRSFSSRHGCLCQ